MSHFVALAIVDLNGDLDSQLSPLMAPYDENLEVDPYIEKNGCSCIGFDQHEQAVAEYAEKYPNMEDNDHRRKFIGKRLGELEHKPSPNCERCGGSGDYETTYNPNSKWDWYQVGGRWQGYLGGSDILPVSTVIRKLEADENLTPYAVVTSEGWFERGQMGWFGYSSGDKPHEEWSQEVLDLLKGKERLLAVVVDCHI